MGGGLLQKVNRDTMSFATKLSHVVYADGTRADIMKSPTGDTSKISFPGMSTLAQYVMLSVKVHSVVMLARQASCAVAESYSGFPVLP